MSENRPTAKTFRNPLLMVLGQLSNLDERSVVMYRDTYEPVCAMLGIGRDDFGNAPGTNVSQVEKWIGYAYKNLRQKNLAMDPKELGKGRWALTDDGISTASVLLKGSGVETPPVVEIPVVPEGDIPLSPSEATAALASAVADFPGSNVGESFGLVEATDSFPDEPYLRSLALQATACFGYFSLRSYTQVDGQCKNCPVAHSCQMSALSRLSKFAAVLDAEDGAEVQKRKEAARLKAERDARKLRGEPEVLVPVQAPPEEPIKDRTVQQILEVLMNENGETPAGAKIMKVRAESICCVCDQPIPPGDECWWKKGEGTWHKTCKNT